MLRLTIGSHTFVATLEEEAAPKTCALIRGMLPIRAKLLQGRWSGESCWIPLSDEPIDLPHENQTSYPAPGEMLFYPGGASVVEILVPYGPTVFSSRVGLLIGNHFATIADPRAELTELGRRALWEGAQDVLIEEA